jgi:hypothetical protein
MNVADYFLMWLCLCMFGPGCLALFVPFFVLACMCSLNARDKEMVLHLLSTVSNAVVCTCKCSQVSLM